MIVMGDYNKRRHKACLCLPSRMPMHEQCLCKDYINNVYYKQFYAVIIHRDSILLFIFVHLCYLSVDTNFTIILGVDIHLLYFMVMKGKEIFL